MKTSLLVAIAAYLFCVSAHSCLQCVKLGKTYYISKQDEVICEKVENIGNTQVKFSAKSGMQCTFLDSVLSMIRGKGDMLQDQAVETTVADDNVEVNVGLTTGTVKDATTPSLMDSSMQDLKEQDLEAIQPDMTFNVQVEVTTGMTSAGTTEEETSTSFSDATLNYLEKLEEISVTTQPGQTASENEQTRVISELTTTEPANGKNTTPYPVATSADLEEEPESSVSMEPWLTAPESEHDEGTKTNTKETTDPTLEKALMAFDKYADRIFKSMRRIRLIFTRKLTKHVPLRNSRRTLV